MIICIGREFGSGGHEIGRKVAEKLGLELYDRDLIDKAAEKIVAMPKDVLEKADEIVYLSDAVRTIYWNKQRLIILVCLLQPRLNGV